MKNARELGKIYQNGEVIVRQGEVGDCIYIVQEGKIEVVLETEDREIRLAERGEGGIDRQNGDLRSRSSHGHSTSLGQSPTSYCR